MRTNSTPKPAATGGAAPLPGDIDLIAGDPPVPITVWRTARTAADDPGVVGRRLAARIVSTYSRPGEPVVDLTDGDTLAAACHAGARRHHRAWFTDASALIVGPPTSADPVAAGSDPPPDDIGARPVEVAAWFGDDLTDPDLPPPDDDLPPSGDDTGGLAGRTSLVVGIWPLDPTSAASGLSRLRFLLRASRRLLRPGGCLVLVVTSGDRPAAVDFTPLVVAAAEAGLGYLQHIVAVAAEIDGDQFTYYATGADLAHLDEPATDAAWYLHVRAHHDLLIFIAQTAGDRGETHG
jgi:hypothetical protein